ncbi:hypothetical protein JTB14_030960 [Gonioctena quinquepunctata]|nr:hypothetical protein JTB14_030960 [Gonioctena quinquepunctata]
MQTVIIKKAHGMGHFAFPKTEEVVKKEKKEGILHPIPKQEGPLHTYHVDYLGPMPSTNKNYHYILAIVDDFSKFTWLYACKSTTTKEVIDCLEEQKQVFGNPEHRTLESALKENEVVRNQTNNGIGVNIIGHQTLESAVAEEEVMAPAADPMKMRGQPLWIYIIYRKPFKKQIT